MAITRKLLKGMGLTEEQQDTIIEAHTDTVNGLKADIDRYKTEAEKLPAVQKELDGYKSKGDDGYKERYEKEHKDFEDYKSSVKAKETAAAKEKAYAELAKKAGVSDKRLQAVLRIAKAEGKLDGIELDEGGNIKNPDDVEKSMKTDYSDFIVKKSVIGANPANPPANEGGRKFDHDEIYAKENGRYKMSAEERQKAIAESLANEASDD